jgi:L-fuconolactonase
MIVDAHAHVWTLDTERYPWQPTFGFVPSVAAPPRDLLASMDRHGIQHTVLVQPSAYGPDHRFLLDTVRAHPTRFVAVGLVDPSDAANTAAASRLVQDGACVGLRINLSLDMDHAARQADGPGWPRLEALGVPLLLRATPAHQPLVVRILAAHAATRMVIDHLGLPDIGSLAETEARLGELARFDHCWVKVAGLGTLSREGPPFRDAWPVVERARRAFGAARLVWGSDFPTCGAGDGYWATIEAMASMPFFSPSERDLVMCGNALTLWGSPRHPEGA